MDKFTRDASLPLAWYNRASDLYASAAALWVGSQRTQSAEIVRECALGEGFSMAVATGPVFRMLCGMSLELLFKAIAVAKGCNVKDNTHNLVHLAEHVEMHLDQNEKGLLGVLTEAIYWSGRYPVPKKREAWDRTIFLQKEHLFDKMPFGTSHVLTPNGALDWPAYNDIWRTVASVYWELHEKQVPCI